jgi:hypothetical protein
MPTQERLELHLASHKFLQIALTGKVTKVTLRNRQRKNAFFSG